MIRIILALVAIVAVAYFAPVSQPKSSIALEQIQTDTFKIDRNAVAKEDRAWFVEAVIN